MKYYNSLHAIRASIVSILLFYIWFSVLSILPLFMKLKNVTFKPGISLIIREYNE